MIILDENIETYWIHIIQKKGYKYFSIRENCPGISDKEVIEITRKNNGILVTEDKDFGELLFSHGIDKISVIFMRYDQPNYTQIEKSFIKCLDDYQNYQDNCFITISKNKVRVKKIY